MQRFFVLLILLAGLAFGKEGLAQKKAKTATTQKASKEDLPPEVEKLESTKIDPVPVQERLFDSSAAPADDLTAALKEMLVITDAVNLALGASDAILVQQKKENANPQMEQFFVLFQESYKSQRVRSLFENMFIKLYRKHYTLEEVQAINAWYGTPLGKKTLQVMPATMQEAQTEGGELGRMLAMEIVQQLMDQENDK